MSTCKRVALLIVFVCLLLWVVAAGTAWWQWPIHPRVARVGVGLSVGGLLVAAMLWFTPGSFRDIATPALTRRYYREFAPPMIAYFAVMLGWKRVLAAVEAPWLRIAVALLPAVFLAMVIRALIRYVRDSDEMQRRIELESIGLASGIVGTAYMAGGFLQSAKVIAVESAGAMLWVFPALCLCYGVFRIVIARRYA